MMTGSLKKKKNHKKSKKKKKKKGGCSVIRACSLIRSNTVSRKPNQAQLCRAYLVPCIRRSQMSTVKSLDIPQYCRHLLEGAVSCVSCQCRQVAVVVLSA